MTMKQRWQDWVGLVLGAWMFLTPWIFGFTEMMAAAYSAHILGIGAALFFAVALYRPEMWEEWVNLALAVLMVVSPFVLAFTNEAAAAWNHWVVGLLIGADAAWAMMQSTPHRESRQHG